MNNFCKKRIYLLGSLVKCPYINEIEKNCCVKKMIMEKYGLEMSDYYKVYNFLKNLEKDVIEELYNYHKKCLNSKEKCNNIETK